jgi:hypothetical protein
MRHKPNIVVDMVGACISHYKKMGTPVKTIRLNPFRFSMLKKFVESKDEEVKVVDKIVFKDIEILLDKFATQTMTWEFKEPKTIE